MGSLTGEVDSYSATELYKGWLTPDGNRSDSANAKASLTARLTSRAWAIGPPASGWGAKAGVSDPPWHSGMRGA